MNYATLSQAIQDWLNKDSIGNVIPTLIRFAQRSLEDELRIRAMEYTPANAPVLAGVSSLVLPSDYLELKYLTFILDTTRYTVQKRNSIYALRRLAIDTTDTGTPYEVARSGDNLYFDLTTDVEYTREWCYYRRLTQLVATAPANTNWWSENAEEAFLMTCLDKASKYISGIPEGDKRKWSEAAGMERERLVLLDLKEQISGAPMRSEPWS